MSGGFKRLTITGHRKQDCSDQAVKGPFEVYFNPNSYSRKCEVVYHARQGAGDTGSPQIYGKSKPNEYTFELVFDGTGAVAADVLGKGLQGGKSLEGKKINVFTALDEFFGLVAGHDGELHRPLYLQLQWGNWLSKCIFKSAEVTYTLFNADGNPLRAKARVTFSENVSDVLRVAKNRNSSPDLTHVHIVQAGEHLTQLVDRYYGDPSRYLQVAAYNELTDFRRLVPGQKLVFPPIQESKR